MMTVNFLHSIIFWIQITGDTTIYAEEGDSDDVLRREMILCTIGFYFLLLLAMLKITLFISNSKLVVSLLQQTMMA